MIPKESTPIKHTILIEIIAQGRLTYDEVRVASFVMRWSWGFDEGTRRQDWTKEFTISEIAQEMKMDRGLCSRTINKMINDGKLLRDGNKFQFNEHYENWKVLQKVTPTVAKSHGSVAKSHTSDIEQTQIDIDVKDEKPLRKDTYKDTKDKDTIKIINIALKNEKQEISLKDEKQEKAKELIKQFCALREIPLDSGFFSKNIRSARSLVGYYPVELILAGIVWRLKNDPDNFWTQKLWSLNSVYSHFAEWIAQSKLKTEKTFTDWLIRNPKEDYRSIEEPDAKIKAFFVAFNRALKDGICPLPEEWTKYQKARELNNESLQRR
jgi:predicted regulator of amino acid metabolism with ACT domain